MTQPASLSIRHDGYQRLLADITEPAQPAGTRCRDCGGPLLPTLTQRASGLGPGPVVWACRDAQTLPYLPDHLRAACGAPNAAGRLWLAWQAAQQALDHIRLRLRVFELATVAPTAQQLADLRMDAHVAWYAELAAEAAYVKAANALHGWPA